MHARGIQRRVGRFLVVEHSARIAVVTARALHGLLPAAAAARALQFYGEPDACIVARPAEDALDRVQRVERHEKLRSGSLDIDAVLREETLHSIVDPYGRVAGEGDVRLERLALMGAHAERLLGAAIAHLHPGNGVA